ncbi:MAG: TorF family putative porin [Gammaproteobacteria bacterium]|uniref:TorF family putative porin n=1 Tax=Limnobacter sp. TaxID=2003368 RepID=UPI001DF795B0|nr:TorF family putative porin [Limnobacter sp.]MBU0782281.1 TorF family putative porin [Gammaproteobacteria bacterium]MBU0849869.1 TorF family putative porin [Gammaproteobacteria bacterium]MBU1267256.1 TorF family putative porin [Gammaproteobacteria bacterium]MBU1530282.1 TorF family putative porin [Gammaproteobacteria bacterium]MBU1781181.1 TorF family putative porin [Gammaproteobacteria bacterium]
MKKLVLVTAIAACTFGAVSTAQADVTTTANANITTDYKFRGISQTNAGPAFQGGFDAAFSNGFYVGNWNSNINNLGAGSSGLEMDFYGGYAGEFSGIGYDVGALYYFYEGYNQGTGPDADTLEVYGKLSYAGAYAKLSVAASDDYFAFTAANGSTDQGGSTYLDLGYSFALSEQLSLAAHYGLTTFDKDMANLRAGTGTIDSYADYSIGATYAISPKYSVTAAYIETDDDAQALINNDDLTDGSLVVTFSAKF